MAFFQTPPQLGNQYRQDAFITEYVGRLFPANLLPHLEDEYSDLGELSGGECYRAQIEDLRHEPVHVRWDPWGNRIDRIDVTPLWQRARVLAAERGLVAAAYEGTYGACSRVHQFLLNYLIAPSLDVYSCPLAMTDGAARTLLESGNQALIDRAVSRLISRDPELMWTSGQWMTERTGGSDVGQSETVARRSEDQWRLFGTKWFTSATTAQMALTLARPEGNRPGGRGLALFYVELRDENGRMRNILINRLKDKLGTRKVPTAELALDGAPATLVTEAQNGVRSITPMLNVTRVWNAVMAAAGMRRAVALAKDYASRRRAFGTPLSDKPLHLDTLAGMQAEAEGAALLALRVAELLGRREAGEADENENLVARVMTPIAKLTTGKQAVAIASEALECFGGAGYVEDTGFPRLLADAQVLPIWEGTTNVLSLDTLRALAKEGTFEALRGEIVGKLEATSAPELKRPVSAVQRGLEHAGQWLARAMGERALLEGGARRFSMTMGRCTELALLAHHAQWCLDNGRGQRAAAAARRFACHGVDLINEQTLDDGQVSADSRLLFEH